MLQNQICFYIWTVQANGKFITIAEIDDIAFGKQILDYSFSMMLIFSACKEHFNYCLPRIINCKDHQNRFANVTKIIIKLIDIYRKRIKKSASVFS